MLDIRTSPKAILVQGSREEKNYSGRANSLPEKRGKNDGYAQGRGASGPLAPARYRHHLHGDDRQSAIWLEPVRGPDVEGARLVARGDRRRLQLLRPGRDLA